MYDMNRIVGTHDIIWIVLDTLRYDVAQQAFEQGKLPVLSQFLSDSGWEKRHTPASFTYPAHQAFFSGFLPTPAHSGKHWRLFAAQFAGSQSTSKKTYTFSKATLVQSLAEQGYRTVCIGGVGFFNPQQALGAVLPSLFQEAYWSPATGTGSKHSTEKQVEIACSIMEQTPQRLFLFMNISAIHAPNNMYLPENHPDKDQKNSLAGHALALQYVDRHLAPLFEAVKKRAPAFVIVCADHGTAYGEDGYNGHRLSHEVVWNVPYTDFVVD